MSSTWTDEAGAAYLDTVALLQEEILRLEAELRRRDEAAPEVAPEPRGGGPAEGAEVRVEELSALLAEREEAIGLLCEQLAALEEAAAARSAEWEQMGRWVQELEERVDREETRTADPDEGHRQAEALRAHLEDRERAWEAERSRLDQEIAGLRSRLAEASRSAGDHARAALEDENHRLRDECRRLAALEAEAVEAATLRGRAREIHDQLVQARQALERADDDLRRERIEHEAELAAVRASLASAKAAAPPEMSVDDRIRALRLHLREVHEHEEREREERQLFHRLSRLWRRTASHG